MAIQKMTISTRGRYFSNENKFKMGQELAIEYLENDIYIYIYINIYKYIYVYIQ